MRFYVARAGWKRRVLIAFKIRARFELLDIHKLKLSYVDPKKQIRTWCVSGNTAHR